MVKDRYFLLTGAFGSGKSTLLEHLQSRGIQGIVEPARPILAEQRSIQGNGLPEADPSALRRTDVLPNVEYLPAE